MARCKRYVAAHTASNESQNRISEHRHQSLAVVAGQLTAPLVTARIASVVASVQHSPPVCHNLAQRPAQGSTGK
jgi:hypothetical protein